MNRNGHRPPPEYLVPVADVVRRVRSLTRAEDPIPVVAEAVGCTTMELRALVRGEFNQDPGILRSLGFTPPPPPATRGECPEGRPCPHWTCRQWAPGGCALDHADGPQDAETIGEVMGVTRQRAVQYIEAAIPRMAEGMREWRDYDSEAPSTGSAPLGPRSRRIRVGIRD